MIQQFSKHFSFSNYIPHDSVLVKVFSTLTTHFITTYNQSAPPAPIIAPPSSHFFPFAEKWKLQMVNNFAFINCDELIQLLWSNQDILLVTNGGADELSGLFVWVIASSVKILVECGGQVSSNEPYSFRCKAFAMTSGLVLLRLLCYKCYIEYTGTIAILSNSKSYIICSCKFISIKQNP